MISHLIIDDCNVIVMIITFYFGVYMADRSIICAIFLSSNMLAMQKKIKLGTSRSNTRTSYLTQSWKQRGTVKHAGTAVYHPTNKQ